MKFLKSNRNRKTAVPAGNAELSRNAELSDETLMTVYGGIGGDELAPSDKITEELQRLSQELRNTDDPDKSMEIQGRIKELMDSLSDGDNSGGGNPNLSSSLAKMRTAAPGLSGKGTTVSVTDNQNANTALKELDQALQSTLKQEASVGAALNRPKFTTNNLSASSENIQSAESTYSDANMAKQMTDFTKETIRQKTEDSMLSQANETHQGVLSLLQ